MLKRCLFRFQKRKERRSDFSVYCAGFLLLGGEWEHMRFAREFYVSAEWKRCRAGFIRSRGGLCERCAAKGLIVAGCHVHHKVRLTLDNIKDPSVALDWGNLELLCEDCHQAEHAKIRWRVSEDGHVEL